jgi:hypothetical protein
MLRTYDTNTITSVQTTLCDLPRGGMLMGRELTRMSSFVTLWRDDFVDAPTWSATPTSMETVPLPPSGQCLNLNVFLDEQDKERQMHHRQQSTDPMLADSWSCLNRHHPDSCRLPDCSSRPGRYERQASNPRFQFACRIASVRNPSSSGTHKPSQAFPKRPLIARAILALFPLRPGPSLADQKLYVSPDHS